MKKYSNSILKCLCAILVISLLATTAFATGSSTASTSSDSTMNELNVTNAINNYFLERKEFLRNANCDNLHYAIADMLPDEATHRNTLSENGIIYIDSTFSISDVACTVGFATATVSESVTYFKDGISKIATVTHKITVAPNGELAPIVSGDGYYEEFSGFKSCSYIPDVLPISTTASSDGSSGCISVIAENEVGYVGTNDNTKYGIWYGMNYQPWCAMFVSWCADQANIPTSVIPKTSVVSGFIKNLTFVKRNTNGPSVGDLAIYSGRGHVGIVTEVDSVNNVYYVVNGNTSSDTVARDCFTFESTSIEGFCQPDYTATTHSYYWAYNISKHWRVCSNCGVTGLKYSHTFSNSICTTCGCTEHSSTASIATPIE